MMAVAERGNISFSVYLGLSVTLTRKAAVNVLFIVFDNTLMS